MRESWSGRGQAGKITLKRGALPQGRGWNIGWTKGVIVSVLLSGCVADASVNPRQAHYPAPQAPVTRPPASAYVPAPRPPMASRAVAPVELQRSIAALGQNFNGVAGISVRRVDADWEVSYNGGRLMPQQSVSKLWVAMTMLDAIDRDRLTMSDPVTISGNDLTLFHQPVAAMMKGGTYTTTLSDLYNRAMQQSDNTANDAILRKVGGPEAVRGFLARRFIPDIRFGPGERLLQSKTAGLTWNQSMSIGRNFYTARANLPKSVREKALDDYLANPPDGAAASSITLALAKLKRGEMLSPSSTAYLISTMEGAKTGPQRIKGGVPAGWRYGHKTGTGQDLAPRSTGYNDVGIMTAPDGTSYAVAVMIGSTTAAIPERWQLMQGVSRAIAASHRK
ncbi:MAG: serine hydrolase [Sphingobium sp.]|nr:serine hydrolase [Sphingobium sp.]